MSPARVAALVTAAAAVCAGCAVGDAGAPPAVTALRTDAHCGSPSAGAARLAAAGDAVQVRLSMGRRNSGGHAVRLHAPRPVRIDDGVAVVAVDWVTPAPDAVTTAVMTRPCLEIAVPADYDGVRFVDRSGTVRGTVRWSGDRD